MSVPGAVPVAPEGQSLTTRGPRPAEPPGDRASGLAVSVRDLTVAFGRGADRREVVRGISFDVPRGRCVAVVGESGSGKSVTARTLVGLTGAQADVRARRLELGGTDLLGAGERTWRSLRGGKVGLVLQDALVSLDPVRSVGREIEEVLRLHTSLDRTGRRRAAVDLLAEVGVPEPELKVRQLPHELSGGQRQRALIATALAGDPELVIADEPTTALDVTVQAQVLDLLGRLRAAGRSLLLISHDLAVVARMADEVIVLRDGEVVERGETHQVLANPGHPYTRGLIDAVPIEHAKGTRLSPGNRPATSAVVTHAGAPAASRAHEAATVVAEARDVHKAFRGPDGELRPAVRGVSFRLRAGRTLGIVGESGSGKTTTGRILLGLTEPDTGSVLVHGTGWSSLRGRARREHRRQIQVIHQDPLSSFDPRHVVGRILGDALRVADVPRSELRARATELLRLVGLAEEHLDRRPLQMSGGQRQRVAIARALAPEPSVVVCDEPVSALDVSVQAQVLDLLADVQDRTGVAYVFISHDLGVVHHVSDHVLVMHQGDVVEQGDARRVLKNPQHPYTQQLVAAVPRVPRPVVGMADEPVPGGQP